MSTSTGFVIASPARQSTLAQFAAGALRFSKNLFANQPASPVLSNRAAEAEGLRAIARSYAMSEPSFAEDLFAAADRHEQLL